MWKSVCLVGEGGRFVWSDSASGRSVCPVGKKPSGFKSQFVLNPDGVYFYFIKRSRKRIQL